MKMEFSSSGRSPSLSENNSGSFINSWDQEDSSISGLNIDHNHELANLVEDKDIAAKAVAYVVNSTRKGIVSLCSDVAQLLRSKKSLETKVTLLKAENEMLRSSRAGSLRMSQSTSPTPASLTSYSERGSYIEHGHFQPSSRPCSRCSSLCSSVMSNSPKLEKYSHRSPHLPRASAFARSRNTEVTMATIHPPPCGMQNDESSDSSPQEMQERKLERKNSLPEIIAEPRAHLPKINPKTALVDKETQCGPGNNHEPKIEDQFKDTLKLNSKLAEDLGAAQKEIEFLKGKLKEIEMVKVARRYMDQYHLENECESGKGDHAECSCPESPLYLPILAHVSKSHSSKTSTSHDLQKSHGPTPILMPSPLKGCKCSGCDTVLQDEGENSNEREFRQTECNSQIKHRHHVEIDDHVVLKGDRTGYVKYIGHLDSINAQKMLFVGLELDAPVGQHDGFMNGKRYFTSGSGCGTFVPMHEVVGIIKKNHEKEKRKSSSHGHMHKSSSDKKKYSHRHSSKREHEKRYLTPENNGLKLPRDIDLTNGHLV